MSRADVDILSLYMKEVAKHPLLSAPQEKELAVLVAKGEHPARQEMIQANLRLVVKIARRYVNRGLPVYDMIEEGNIGLMHAVEKFDLSHGCRFSTYATWWIRQSIERAIMNQARLIRLPVHIAKEYHSVMRATASLRGIMGREPREDEIAEHMGKERQRINTLFGVSQIVDSADSYFSGSDDTTLYDVTSDLSASDPDEHQIEMDRVDAVERWLAHLSQQEVAVVTKRFGLHGKDTQTLESIGREMNITRERVRQIQVAALRKLQNIAKDDFMTLDDVI